MDRAERFYRAVNSTLLRASDDSRRGLQTTLTAVYTAGADLFYAHVGHSRAYVFRDDQLLQLTRDHTLDAGGPIGPVDVATSAQDQHHIITQTLGTAARGALRFDVERCGLLNGDQILLCTNGLTDIVDDERIADVLRRQSTPDDQCRALVDLAVNSRGTDDVTVLTAHYRIRARADAVGSPLRS